MSDADAQSALDQSYHALRDLAYVLDIEPYDISLGGKPYGELFIMYEGRLPE